MTPSPQQRSSRGIRCGDRFVPFGRVPLIMGVLNVTPDSFSDGGRFLDVDTAVKHAVAMDAAGAAIIDVGGESTRPGSDPVGSREEMDRVMPVLKRLLGGGGALAGDQHALVSIDTNKAEVAAAAIELGCHLVNDVTAAADPAMVELVRRHADRISLVIMHKKGTTRTMQAAPHYDDPMMEIKAYLAERAKRLVAAGISADGIIIDPGIGFGKRCRDNLELLNHVDELYELGYPVLIGGSRKAFLGELLDADPDHRLAGSLGVAAACYHRGVDIVRVHDVKETADLLRTMDAVAHPEDYSADGY